MPKLNLNHPNQDFFIPDMFDSLGVPFKDDMASMEHPIFSLSKKRDLRNLEYKNGDVSISIKPNTDGLPTIFDKDILLYCSSLLMAEINAGRTPPRTLRVSCRDILVSTNRRTDGDDYERLKKSLDRLQGVTIKTNIKTNNREITRGFGVFDSYEVIESSRIKDRMVRLEITLSEWFYNSVLGKEVLTIHRDYFLLRKPIERRLYEIARKHCGKQNYWSISLTPLMDKVGSTGTLRRFRYNMHQIAKDNHLPDYSINIKDDDKVTFYNRNPIIENDKQPLLGFDSNLPVISFKAMDIARDIVRNSKTGWDFYALESDFKDSIRKGFEPDNVDGAFISFIKKKVAKVP